MKAAAFCGPCKQVTICIGRRGHRTHGLRHEHAFQLRQGKEYLRCAGVNRMEDDMKPPAWQTVLRPPKKSVIAQYPINRRGCDTAIVLLIIGSAIP